MLPQKWLVMNSLLYWEYCIERASVSATLRFGLAPTWGRARVLVRRTRNRPLITVPSLLLISNTPAGRRKIELLVVGC
jgi:hypothetical protein